MLRSMPWNDSPDYQQPIRGRDIIGIISLLLLFPVGLPLHPHLPRRYPLPDSTQADDALNRTVAGDAHKGLSEPGRTALRLVFDRRLGVGELAALLGEPYDTVKARLKVARRALGATSTQQAARLLAEAEGAASPVRGAP